MCEPCREKSRRLHDAERRCDRPGCTNTWTWTAAAQLEAFAADRPAPKHLCTDCQSLLDTLEDKEIACTVPGCTRSAVQTRQQQLIAHGQPDAEPEAAKPGAVTLAGTMCEPCSQVSRRIKDREVGCGINGCSRKWTWKADDQIVAFAAGKPNEPPRRMCDSCRTSFGKLGDREVRCRTSGCKNTWTWSRFDQLDACQADKTPPKAPSHMCQRCFDLWSTLRDVERPCRRSTCKGTWMDKRGAQLARAVRGKTGDPYPHLCTNCEKELGDLEDREIQCRTEHCPGTFTWTKEQQLAAGVRPKLKEPEAAQGEPSAGEARLTDAQHAEGQAALPSPEAEPSVAGTEGEATSSEVQAAVATTAPSAPSADKQPAEGRGKRNKRKRRREVQPPERRCPACAEFLANRKTQEIPCMQCGTPIFWPPESQLQTHLGNWAAPSICGACKLIQVTAARDAAREVLRHQHPGPVEQPPAVVEVAPATDTPAVETPTDG